LTRSDIDVAAAVLGRGMRDNPIHERAFGRDPRQREAVLTKLFTGIIAVHIAKGAVLGAFSGTALVGVCSMVPPGGCRLSGSDKLRMVPTLVALDGVAAAMRAMQWASAWAKRDPAEPHWHLGPVGVERGLQGRGVGGTLLRAFCARMDEARSTAYLETDKPENVSFYRRFGFAVVGQHRVLGIPNWFMLRHAARQG
jgi:ribosomal protein S18 acetylase RimI-like enzyme